MLNGNVLQFEWDDSNLKETEEAKVEYQKARKEGRKIVTLDGAVVEGFRANLLGFKVLAKELTASQFAMRIINETGDERVVWDSKIKKEIKEAAKLFTDYLDKGWKAYAVESDGETGRRVVAFDADLEEVTFRDKVKMKLSKFAESFEHTQLIPSTRAA